MSKKNISTSVKAGRLLVASLTLFLLSGCGTSEKSKIQTNAENHTKFLIEETVTEAPKEYVFDWEPPSGFAYTGRKGSLDTYKCENGSSVSYGIYDYTEAEMKNFENKESFVAMFEQQVKQQVKQQLKLQGIEANISMINCNIYNKDEYKEINAEYDYEMKFQGNTVKMHCIQNAYVCGYKGHILTYMMPDGEPWKDVFQKSIDSVKITVR